MKLICGCSFMLYGYDAGVLGSVLLHKPFLDTIGNPQSEYIVPMISTSYGQAACVTSLIVGTLKICHRLYIFCRTRRTGIFKLNRHRTRRQRTGKCLQRHHADIRRAHRILDRLLLHQDAKPDQLAAPYRLSMRLRHHIRA
jgi:hypothetical protein